MIKYALSMIILAFILTSCNPFKPIWEPRNVDWKKEWKENGEKLKRLTYQIKENRDDKYRNGIYSFPNNFEYPFNDGFHIDHGNQGSEIDTNSISIKYYVDRGLLDHFSAFIYTKDSSEIRELERKLQQNGNDYKIEDNWYMVND